MERYELPDGWEWKKIGEVASTTSGGTPSRTRPEFYKGSIPWLKSGELEDNYISETEEKISESGLKNSSAKIFSKGTALVALYGATVGKTGILQIDSATNQAVCALFPRDNSFTAEYMTYWLRSQRQSLIELSTGGAQPNISQGIIRDFDIPLPSLPEQQRIVAKIESLFEQSRAARDALTRVPALMLQFRRAVLDSATSGRLTEEWRETHPDTPEHRSVSLREVATEFKYGTSAKSQKTGEVPVLRMGNIQDRKLDWNDLVFTSDKSEIEKYKLVSGDVLFNRTNSPELVGKTAVYKGERPAIYAGYLIKVKCSDALLPDYLNYCLNSPAGRDWASQVKSDGVSQSNINAQKLADFEFDLPPIEEQIEIVSRVEKLFAQADIIEQAASVSLRRAEQVDQSILARAFRGELG